MSATERTQVIIIGAGPAGLLLSHLLHRQGIESVVLESRARPHLEKRVRAGVLEHPTVELLREVGLGERMDREGLAHGGFSLRFAGEDHRIDLEGLTGKSIMVYGQQEVVKDLLAAHDARGQEIRFEVTDVEVLDAATENPRVRYTDAAGEAHELVGDVVAGCDGFHGVSKRAIPPELLTTHDHIYPQAWLGILAQTPPSHEELIYAWHPRGFALHSMRSPSITRLYIQVDRGTDAADWSDDQIWSELSERLALGGNGFELTAGPIIDKGVTEMRSVVVEPMRYGRLFLAGDSAHIVPPTGAKGMNLAIADVARLTVALTDLLQGRGEARADAYSDAALRRVWRAQHFSSTMTRMLHSDPGEDAFAAKLRLGALRHTTASTSASRNIAEQYVGLPHEI